MGEWIDAEHEKDGHGDVAGLCRLGTDNRRCGGGQDRTLEDAVDVVVQVRGESRPHGGGHGVVSISVGCHEIRVRIGQDHSAVGSQRVGAGGVGGQVVEAVEVDGPVPAGQARSAWAYGGGGPASPAVGIARSAGRTLGADSG